MTISPELEIQALIVSRLKADTAIMALVHGIYDVPPPDPWGAKKAYISLGATDTTTDDADCIVGLTHTVQVDVWSRSVGMPVCKAIMAAVKRNLHQTTAQLSENGLNQVNMVFARTLRDPDGLTNHGVLQFEFRVEDLDDE